MIARPANQRTKESGIPWIGSIPEHWELHRYKRLFRERDERSRTGEETLLSVSAYSGVSPRAALLDDGELEHRAASLEGYKICRKGDLVMNIMLAWNRAQGITQFDGIVSPAYSVFDVVGNADRRYLNYLVRCDTTTAYFKAWSYGIIDSRLRLYPETFGSLFCALPPKSEQTLIADHLDRDTARIDRLVAKKTRFLELLREKRQAIITHAVTRGLDAHVSMKESGVEWLRSIPEHWTPTRLRFITSKIGSGKTPSGGATTYLDEGVPFLRSQNVHDDGLRLEDVVFISEQTHREMQGSAVHPGDVLLNLTGASIGRASLVPADFGEANVNQHVCILRCRPAGLKKWLHWVLCSHVAKDQVAGLQTGAGREGLNFEQVGNFALAVPPETERNRICLFLEAATRKIDLLIGKTERSIELLKEHRTALITAAVTGKIDLREAA